MVAHGDQLRAVLRQDPRGPAADVAEALDGESRPLYVDSEILESPHRAERSAATGGREPTPAAAQLDRFAGHDAR